MLDKVFITHKIELIRQDLEKLKIFKNQSFDEVAKDWIKYSALKNILMEIIGRAIDINQHLIGELSKPKDELPLDYTETFLKLGGLNVLPESFAEKIAKSAGFRNAVVHGYNQLDKYIVYDSVKDAIGQYVKYCDYVLKFISTK